MFPHVVTNYRIKVAVAGRKTNFLEIDKNNMMKYLVLYIERMATNQVVTKYPVTGTIFNA